MSWDPRNIEFQFSKCGPWCSALNFPGNPTIVKPAQIVPIIESPLEVSQTITVIKSLLPDSKEFLDNPILIINKMEKLNLTNAKKAHYYRYLYIHMRKNFHSFRLTDLYTKYYEGWCLTGLGYTWKERELIRNCKDSEIHVSQLYMDAFFKYARYY